MRWRLLLDWRSLNSDPSLSPVACGANPHFTCGCIREENAPMFCVHRLVPTGSIAWDVPPVNERQNDSHDEDHLKDRPQADLIEARHSPILTALRFAAILRNSPDLSPAFRSVFQLVIGRALLVGCSASARQTKPALRANWTLLTI